MDILRNFSNNRQNTVKDCEEYFSVCLPSSLIEQQLSLANPRNALHHGKRAANKSGRSM